MLASSSDVQYGLGWHRVSQQGEWMCRSPSSALMSMGPRLKMPVALSFFTQDVDEHVFWVLSFVAAVVVGGGDEHVLLNTSTQAWIIGVHR